MVHIDDQSRRRLLVSRQLLGSAHRCGRDVADVARALGLLHSTDPSTPYLSIHARSDATIADVDAAFYDECSLLRHTTIRRTVFAMPLDTAAAAHGAVNVGIVGKLRSNLLGWIDASPDTDTAAEVFLAAVENAVVEHLRDHGPATGAQLAEAIPALRVRVDPAPGAAYSKPMRITSKVLEVLAAEGLLARGRPTGATFTSGSWTWEPIDRWSPGGIEVIEPAEALARLVTSYLRAFGPATLTDITWWAGTTRTRVRTALTTIGAAEVDLDDDVEPGWVLDVDEIIEFLEAADEAAAIAALPGLDSTTMGWKRRAWYVDDLPATGLFDRNGNAGPTLWVGGRVVGTWTQRSDGEIAHVLATEVGASERDDIDRELERLATWLGDVRVKWRYPTPLTRRLSA